MPDLPHAAWHDIVQFEICRFIRDIWQEKLYGISGEFGLAVFKNSNLKNAVNENAILF